MAPSLCCCNYGGVGWRGYIQGMEGVEKGKVFLQCHCGCEVLAGGDAGH